MIYIIQDKEFIEELLIDVNKEYKNAIKINIFCYKDIEEYICDGIINNKAKKELINIYTFNCKIKIDSYKKIFGVEEFYKFKDFFKSIVKFNYEQYEASILAGDFNLLINAGAGTGKTTTAVESVINILLSNKANPDEILMMTFTNNSTEDMYKKIYGELQKRYVLTYNERCLYLLENIKELKICTIHTYLKSIIEQIGFVYGYSKEVNFGVSIDKLKNFIDSQVDFRFENRSINHDDYKMYDRDLKDIIYKFVMNGNLNISNIEDYLIYNEEKDQKYIKNINDIIIDVCKKVDTDFMQDLILDDKILLKDLEYRLSNILKYDFKFKNTIKNYKYMFIDECQDTSKYQFEVISTIAGIINSKIFAVGDNMQAIYRFRSADPKSMKRFENNTDKFIKLIKNYRTDKSILNPINKAFQNIESDYHSLVAMKENNSNGLHVKKYKYEEEKFSIIKDIISYENKNIIELRKKDNKFNDRNRIAILTRTNKDAEIIYNKLNEKNVKCTLANGGELFRTKSSKDLLALIRCILYKNNYVAKLQLLNSEYISSNLNITGTELLSQYDYKLIIDDFVESIINKFDVCYKCILKDKCKKNCEKFINQSKKTVFSILTDLIMEIEITTKLSEIYKKNMLLVIEELMKNNCISTLTDMERFLDLQLNSSNDIKSYEERTNSDEIIISTFHSSKGLEFDTVIVLTDYDYLKNLGQKSEILIGIENQKIGGSINEYIEVSKIGMLYKNKNNMFNNFYYEELCNLEKSKLNKDEINLLYVALTRAMNKLYVLCPKDIHSNTHASILKDAEFID